MELSKATIKAKILEPLPMGMVGAKFDENRENRMSLL